MISPDDTHGLIVQVSLWSDDGKQEKMLVTSTRQIAYIEGMAVSSEISGSSLYRSSSNCKNSLLILYLLSFAIEGSYD